MTSVYFKTITTATTDRVTVACAKCGIHYGRPEFTACPRCRSDQYRSSIIPLWR